MLYSKLQWSNWGTVAGVTELITWDTVDQNIIQKFMPRESFTATHIRLALIYEYYMEFIIHVDVYRSSDNALCAYGEFQTWKTMSGDYYNPYWYDVPLTSYYTINANEEHYVVLYPSRYAGLKSQIGVPYSAKHSNISSAYKIYTDYYGTGTWYNDRDCFLQIYGAGSTPTVGNLGTYNTAVGINDSDALNAFTFTVSKSCKLISACSYMAKSGWTCGPSIECGIWSTSGGLPSALISSYIYQPCTQISTIGTWVQWDFMGRDANWNFYDYGVPLFANTTYAMVLRETYGYWEGYSDGAYTYAQTPSNYSGGQVFTGMRGSGWLNTVDAGPFFQIYTSPYTLGLQSKITTNLQGKSLLTTELSGKSYITGG